MPSHYSYGDIDGGDSGTPNPFASITNTSPNSYKTQEQGHKPCRACTDFKTWRKQQEKSVSFIYSILNSGVLHKLAIMSDIPEVK